MAFDTLVSNAGRLEILTALAVEEVQDFVTLRRRTHLTDGNLASHAKRLQGAGLVAVDKTFREGKPVTSFKLTVEGRKALEQHVRRLMSALSQRRVAAQGGEVEAIVEKKEIAPVMVEAVREEEWVD